MKAIEVILDDLDESTITEYVEENWEKEEIINYLNKTYGKNGWLAFNE